MSSEEFLRFALWKANVTVAFRQAWMYCKFGTWPQCTERLRRRQPCGGGGSGGGGGGGGGGALVCRSWRSTGGCVCRNTSCAQVYPRYARWCTNVSAGASAALPGPGDVYSTVAVHSSAVYT